LTATRGAGSVTHASGGLQWARSNTLGADHVAARAGAASAGEQDRRQDARHAGNRTEVRVRPPLPITRA
jgi:hypothetical protein